MSTILTNAELLDPVEGSWTPALEELDFDIKVKNVARLALTDEQQSLYEFFDREWNDVAFGD